MSNINLHFAYGQNSLMIQCQENDKTKDVFQKFADKVQRNVKDFHFYFNSMEIPSCDKTLYNLQIKNYSQINVVDNTVIGAWINKK